VKNIFIIIAIIAGCVWYFTQNNSNNRLTGISEYNEVRMHLDAGSRTIKMVTYIKRDSSDNCELAKVWWVESTLRCAANTNCTMKKNQCVDDIPSQYKKMFEEKTTDTTYLKASNSMLHREAVMIFWGLSKKESDEVCSAINKQLNKLSSKNKHFSHRCI